MTATNAASTAVLKRAQTVMPPLRHEHRTEEEDLPANPRELLT